MNSDSEHTLIHDASSLPQSGTSGTLIQIVDENLFLLGTFDGDTAEQVIAELERNAQITRIVLTANGGSTNDNETLRLGRYIRLHQLDTHLIEAGVAASGGVSLLLSGKRRSIGKGAYIGVHSWRNCSGRGENERCKTATEFAQDDQVHDLHRDYTIEMLNSDEFYWFSIQAAPHGDIHWLSPTELEKYGVINHQLNQPIEIPFISAFETEYRDTCHNCP